MASAGPSGSGRARAGGTRSPRDTPLPAAATVTAGRAEGCAEQGGAAAPGPRAGDSVRVRVAVCARGGGKADARPRAGEKVGERARREGGVSGARGSAAPERVPGGASGRPTSPGRGGGGLGRTRAELRALPPGPSPPRLGDSSASPGELTLSSLPPSGRRCRGHGPRAVCPLPPSSRPTAVPSQRRPPTPRAGDGKED